MSRAGAALLLALAACRGGSGGGGRAEPGSATPVVAPVRASAGGAAASDDLLDCAFREPTAAESAAAYQRTYGFTSDWFTPDIPHWRGALGKFVGRPGIQYLEVGLYEGRSAIWALENVLTDPSSHLTGIDVFPGNLEQRWLDNVRISGQEARVTTIKGYSQIELRKLAPDSYDIIYIDGSHTGADVFSDAALAWDLLKIGGVLIFDDYRWRRGDTLPAELRPREAIDAFVSVRRSSLDVIHRCYQLVVEKRADPCAAEEHCSPIGRYVYLWQSKTLLAQPSGEAPDAERRPITLAPAERAIIEAVLLGRRWGRTELEASPEVLADKELPHLIQRFGFDFLRPPPIEVRRLRERYGEARYSQHDEETFIRDFFADRRGGVFVDVGASDPRFNSTTYFLEHHLGWSGLAIDAIARFAPAYAEHRPRTRFFTYYVSDVSDAIQPFHVVAGNDRLSSGVDPAAAARAHETVDVPTIRLDDLLAREGVERIDLLSMDIELAEPKALAGFSIEKYRPALVCIESHDEVQGSIEQYFAAHGYVKVEPASRLDPLNDYYRPSGASEVRDDHRPRPAP